MQQNRREILMNNNDLYLSGSRSQFLAQVKKAQDCEMVGPEEPSINPFDLD
jgi:hypothetical protein